MTIHVAHFTIDMKQFYIINLYHNYELSIFNCQSSVLMLCLKLLHALNKSLYALKRQCVVAACTETTY